jgi:hypothetical protein
LRWPTSSTRNAEPVRADWYGNAEAGRLIKSLVAEGNKPQPEEVAKVFGIPFDLRPAEARIRRLAAETSGR